MAKRRRCFVGGCAQLISTARSLTGKYAANKVYALTLLATSKSNAGVDWKMLNDLVCKIVDYPISLEVIWFHRLDGAEKVFVVDNPGVSHKMG